MPGLGRVSGIFDPRCGMKDLSCSVGTPSCGVWDFVLRPGIAPRPSALREQRPSLWTSREVPILIFLMVSQRSLGLYSFSFHLFLSFLELDNFTWLIFKFADSSISYLLLKPSCEFFLSIIDIFWPEEFDSYSTFSLFIDIFSLLSCCSLGLLNFSVHCFL